VAPAAISVGITTNEPRIVKSAKSFRVAHKELVVVSIAGSTTFTVQNFLRLNPGLVATFPWLAPQAQQWEMYRCHKLVAHYVPIAPSSTQGDIIISPNYDASDPQPTTEVQATSNYGAVTDSCWQCFSCPLDVPSMQAFNKRYVRPCLVAGDVKTFDIGTLAICSNNETGTTAVGKLFLEYDFEFFTPQNDPSPATSPLYSSMATRVTAQTFGTGVAAAADLDAFVFNPLAIAADAAGVYTLPAGAYKFEFSGTFTDSAAEAFSILLTALKNGAALTPTIISSQFTTSVAAEQVSASLDGLVVINGTDTFQISVQLTGAAGTLQLVATTGRLIFSLA